jgi:hypothetical protein
VPPDASPAIDPYALDREGLEALLTELGEPAYRAKQVHAWLVRGVDDPAEMTDLPKALRVELAERFAPARPELIAHTVADEGHTHKLLLRYPDGEAIETVLMLYPKRATVCISTQAGCAMGCPFCATGQAGFRRQLTAGEVIRQVVVADAALRSGGIGGLAGEADGHERTPGPRTELPDGAPTTSPTWSSWGWGSRSRTCPRRSRPSAGSTTRRASGSRPAASRSRPWV